MDFTFQSRYGFEDLVKIVALLRAPGGCPWDREQTHRSIRANFIEETYEAVEAIDTDDPDLLREELGDVLLQVAMHARMEEESGRFSIGDVIDGICKKLVVRHPHVFGDVQAGTSEEVLRNWDAIKRRTKKQETFTETLESVPRVLPALMRSEKLQHRAARAGFDWPDAQGPLAKIREELGELVQAADAGSGAACREELGDLLFACVNAARHLGVEPEEALSAACDKFTARFASCERQAAEQGEALSALSPEQLDALWQNAKQGLQSEPVRGNEGKNA